MGTLHFHYLRHENGGFVREAENMEEHLAQLRTGIERSGDVDGIGSFIESFVRPRGLALPVAPIVASEIEALGGDRRSEPDDPRARRLLLRAALTPLALVVCALVAVHWVGSVAGTERRRVERHRGAASSDHSGSLAPS